MHGWACAKGSLLQLGEETSRTNNNQSGRGMFEPSDHGLDLQTCSHQDHKPQDSDFPLAV